MKKSENSTHKRAKRSTKSVKKIENTFYLGQKLPDGIVHICNFYDDVGVKNAHTISGSFELSSSGMESIDSWFGGKSKKAADMLMPFGGGPSGDIYAIWLTNDLMAENAPIVMLGSEGEAEVLAVNHVEFCKLLCLGYDEISTDDLSMPSCEESPESYEKAKPFRDKMLEIYRFCLPKTGDVIVKEAREKFPNFAKWVSEHCVDGLEDDTGKQEFDDDRLSYAFVELNMKGIRALENFGKDEEEGLKKVKSEYRKTGKNAFGFCFYTKQDTQNAISSGKLQITYKAAAKYISDDEVGEFIAKVFKKHNFSVTKNEKIILEPVRLKGADIKNYALYLTELSTEETTQHGSIVSRNILQEKDNLMWCYRNEPQNSIDNGWRFFTQHDDDEFINQSNNMIICDFNLIANIEPALYEVYKMPIGTFLKLEKDDERFYFTNADTEEEILSGKLASLGKADVFESSKPDEEYREYCVGIKFIKRLDKPLEAHYLERFTQIVHECFKGCHREPTYWKTGGENFKRYSPEKLKKLQNKKYLDENGKTINDLSYVLNPKGSHTPEFDSYMKFEIKHTQNQMDICCIIDQEKIDIDDGLLDKLLDDFNALIEIDCGMVYLDQNFIKTQMEISSFKLNTYASKKMTLYPVMFLNKKQYKAQISELEKNVNMEQEDTKNENVVCFVENMDEE